MAKTSLSTCAKLRVKKLREFIAQLRSLCRFTSTCTSIRPELHTTTRTTKIGSLSKKSFISSLLDSKSKEIRKVIALLSSLLDQERKNSLNSNQLDHSGRLALRWVTAHHETLSKSLRPCQDQTEKQKLLLLKILQNLI